MNKILFSAMLLPMAVTLIACGHKTDSRPNTSVPGTVSAKGIGAFVHCNNQAEVAVPDGVTEIDTSAFKGCSSLTAVSLPGSITRIGGGAFICFEHRGKICFLQSISGLSNKVIPAYCGTSCTGAVSVIHNVDKDHEVHIEFYD